jgi:hypothetical protein
MQLHRQIHNDVNKRSVIRTPVTTTMDPLNKAESESSVLYIRGRPGVIATRSVDFH